jgi:hypothetical protein
MPLEPRLVEKVLIKDIKAANSLHRGRINFNTMMDTINFVIIVLRFTPASTHILGVFSGAMLVIAIVEQLIYSVRWSLLFKNMVDVLLSSAPIKIKKFFYLPTHTSVFMSFTRNKKDFLRKRKIHYAFKIIIYSGR